MKYGVGYNRFGDKQKYRCNKCWKWFVLHDFLKKRKYSKEIIAEACSCYKIGMGLKETAEHLNEYKGIRIVSATIFCWVRDYSQLIILMKHTIR